MNQRKKKKKQKKGEGGDECDDFRQITVLDCYEQRQNENCQKYEESFVKS